MSHVTIILNGTPTELADGTSLTDVVASLGHDPTLPGVAAAIDGTVVRRADWPSTVVADGVRVEVLTAVQGGAR